MISVKVEIDGFRIIDKPKYELVPNSFDTDVTDLWHKHFILIMIIVVACTLGEFG